MSKIKRTVIIASLHLLESRRRTVEVLGEDIRSYCMLLLLLSCLSSSSHCFVVSFWSYCLINWKYTIWVTPKQNKKKKVQKETVQWKLFEKWGIFTSNKKCSRRNYWAEKKAKCSRNWNKEPQRYKYRFYQIINKR